MSGLYYNMTHVLIRRGKDIRGPCAESEKTKQKTWGHSKKVAISKPRSEASGETEPVNTFILNCQLPEL